MKTVQFIVFSVIVKTIHTCAYRKTLHKLKPMY